MNNLSRPQQRFLASPHAAKHQEWARSETGKAAIEMVLAEMAMFYKGADLVKLEGAASFAKLLLNFAEPDEKPKQPQSETLKY